MTNRSLAAPLAHEIVNVDWATFASAISVKAVAAAVATVPLQRHSANSTWATMEVALRVSRILSANGANLVNPEVVLQLVTVTATAAVSVAI